MSGLAGLRPRWLLNRRVGVALQWTLLVLAVAITVNVIGISVVGSIQGWQDWLRAQAGYFFVWRVGVYSATAYFWWQSYQQMQRRSDVAGCQRLRLIGVGAIITLLVTESSQWLQHG